MPSYLDLPPYAVTESLPAFRPLEGRRVVLGVCGSIASPKAQQLASALTKAGATVDVVLSETAARFIGSWAFEGIVTGEVLVELGARHPELGSEPHVRLARNADLCLVYPASASFLGALRGGAPVSPIPLIAMNVSPDKLLIVPAMSSEMWHHPSTAENVKQLRDWGAAIVGPATGRLASGATGEGRLVEPLHVAALAKAFLGRRFGDLAGYRIVVSAGGNRERVDDVRWLGNRSSGKQGLALAEAARDRGAAVTLLTGSEIDAPLGMEEVVPFRDHASLRAALHEACVHADAYIAAAAVADFRVKEPKKGKLDRRSSDSLSLALVPNEDLLASLSAFPSLIKVAFAAEGDGSAKERIERALSKLTSKGAAFIVLNDISAADSGFGVSTNRITIFESGGGLAGSSGSRGFTYPDPGGPAAHKYDIAQHVLDHLSARLRATSERS